VTMPILDAAEAAFYYVVAVLGGLILLVCSGGVVCGLIDLARTGWRKRKRHGEVDEAFLIYEETRRKRCP
jgi:hypothetical protein